jgi:hypothetical protein
MASMACEKLAMNPLERAEVSVEVCKIFAVAGQLDLCKREIELAARSANAQGR